MKRKKLELLITGAIYFATGILSGILAILLLTHLHRLTDYFFAGSLAQNAFIPIVLSEIITIFLSLYDGRYAFHRCTLAQCLRRSIVASILFSAALALTLIIEKSGVTDSRYFFVTTGVFHLVILTAALYIVINFLIRNFYKTNAASLCMLVSTRSRAPQAANLLKHDWSRKLTAIALLDDDTATTSDVAGAPPASQASEAQPSAQSKTPTASQPSAQPKTSTASQQSAQPNHPGASSTPREIDHIPVVANRYTYIDYVKTHAIDEVFLIVDRDVRFDPGDAIQPFVEMGVKVHLNLLTVETLHENLQQADSRYIPATRVNLSYMEQDTPVLSIQQPEPKMRWMAAKRALDIVGAIVGLLITAVIFLFVAPAIKLDSPGPIFFAQTRIGKNGRRFKMYKFRSMYQDAEARKAALMQQNEMNGLMFKMKDDPRITRVGRLLRRTSLDEFPQFLNVLIGDMSLVGTRPPTESEFDQYDSYHKRRLSMKPGITGLWQVSGRSEITDFEEIVRLDCRYIDEWSFFTDLRILWKTVILVLERKGSE